MISEQDVLSRSYTDSISSYLYNRMDEELPSNSGMPRSNNSNGNFMTIPNFKDYQSQTGRRGSVATAISSFYGSFNDDHTENNEQVTPLPKLQMFVISLILFSEPLTSTIIFPFIYFMLKDFHMSDDEKEIGAYAGWITSIFFIAQFCTAIMWGKISDRHGRRPVLLTGLVGNSVSACLFGLSKNLWWAIGARALCGAMNGSAGVARSMVSEITDNTNKAKAFSIFGFCWGAGMIGPALGGFLNRPAEQLPHLFGNIQFLKDYPYFLPCFISALGSCFGFIIGYFYLEESNPHVIAHNKLKAGKYTDDNEYTSLLRHQLDEETASKHDMPKSGSLSMISKASISIIISYSTLAFHAMVFDEVLPLYFTAPTNAGGLGVTSKDFAKALSFFGIMQLVMQFEIYPRLTVRYSTLTLCRFSFLILIPIYVLFPELTTLREWVGEGSENWTFRMGYIVLLLFRYVSGCFAYAGLAIMVSSSVAPEILGTVNGLCQSCLSLVRALGPTVGGTLWSISIRDGAKFPFDWHFVYYLITASALFGFIQSFYIPASVALGGRKKASKQHTFNTNH